MQWHLTVFLSACFIGFMICCRKNKYLDLYLSIRGISNIRHFVLNE